jgi:dUTP pyrophosphatase
VQRVEHVRFVEVTELPTSERGAGGYGSTGGHDSIGGAGGDVGGRVGDDLGDGVGEGGME